MALQFHIHTDKENTITPKPGFKIQHGESAIARSKHFSSSKTPVAATPRRALSDVNRSDAFPMKSRSWTQHDGADNFEKKRLPSLNLENKKPSGSKKHVPGHHLKNRRESQSGSRIWSNGVQALQYPCQYQNVCEENMQRTKGLKTRAMSDCGIGTSHLPKTVPEPIVSQIISAVPDGGNDVTKLHTVEEADSDEDIWPMKERVSTYLDQLISWRPQCLFGIQPVSDEDDDEDRYIQQLDLLPKPETFKKEVDHTSEWETLWTDEPLDDVSLADIDEDLGWLGESTQTLTLES